jgi:hypothetical protein
MAVENQTTTRRRTTQPLTFALLCVIAKEQLVADLSIDNGEWADRIKDRLVRLQFAYPDPPQQLTAAMEAVERALLKAGRVRVRVLPEAQSPKPKACRPLSHAEAVSILEQLGARPFVRGMR